MLSLPKTTSTKSVYECAYECAVKCVDESAHDSELDHQPRILKVGSAGRGCRPARVFSSISLSLTVQPTQTGIPKVGRAVKRCRPALVFPTSPTNTRVSNLENNVNLTSSAGNTKSGECREEVPTSPGIPRHLDIPHLRRLCFARYYVACMREYNILLKQGQTIALRLSDHR